MIFSVLDMQTSTILDVLGNIVLLYTLLCSVIGMMKAGKWLKQNAGVRAKNGEICATAVFSVILAGLSCILLVVTGFPYPLFVFCLVGDVVLCLCMLLACRKERSAREERPVA